MQINWQRLTTAASCVIATSDLATLTPFDINHYLASWQDKLALGSTRICVLHQNAVWQVGSVPYDLIADTWQQGCDLLVLDDEGMTTALSEIAEQLAHLESLGIPRTRIMLWSDAGDQGIPYGQSMCSFSNPATNSVAAFTKEISHHYVMLARVPRRHRVLAACDLMDRGLDHLGRISCGSGGYSDYSYGPKEFLVAPERLRHRFPLYIDGPVAHDDLAIHTNSVLHPAVTGALAQLVCETNWDDPDPAISDRWKQLQLTEKSSKPLLLGQLFVINSALGAIDELRQLGFDCFDDVVDHAYDRQPDPYLRVSMVVDQIAAICAKPLGSWQQWRTTNQKRLLDNRQLFLDLAADINDLQLRRFQNAVAAIDTTAN